MSFRVWLDPAEATDLGDPFQVVRLLVELGRQPGADVRWPELLGLVHADDQDLDPGYARVVRTQAQEARLEAVDRRLSRDLVLLLGQLVGRPPARGNPPTRIDAGEAR